MRRFFLALLPVWAGILLAGDLSTDELKMLRDSGGWEYITMSRNQMSGFPTQHACFDGRPHPGQCAGTLTLSGDNKFVQSIRIQGKTVNRTGTYTLNGDQLTFVDELNTQDGPYTFALNAETKLLTLTMPQVKIELLLESEYRKNLEEQRKRDHAR